MKFLDNPMIRFWSFNVLFWTIFYAISVFMSPLYLSFDFYYRGVLIGTSIFWSLLFTGIYYFVYQRFNFQSKSYLFTILQVIISSLVLVLLDVFARFYINPWLGVFKLFHNNYSFDAISRMFLIAQNDKDFALADAPLQKDITIFIRVVVNFVQTFKFLAFVIWTIGFNTYNYNKRLRQKEVEQLYFENRAKDLELINLRSQLNPHFLFNALNSIHSLAMMKKDSASDAVLLLSNLMRYTLNYEKRDVVPLSEEIEVVEKYLQLEKIRFGKKLNAELDISDATLDLQIPPIIVQTLVENAIKHGLKESTEGVFIKINSQLSNNFLTINIINSGRLKKGDPSVYEQKNSGIGVENTRRRLQMIYGERATFDLKNLNEKEVIATLRLPIING
jgi:sensor histidine kinase YesM